jgi:hypothetical protein
MAIARTECSVGGLRHEEPRKYQSYKNASSDFGETARRSFPYGPLMLQRVRQLLAHRVTQCDATEWSLLGEKRKSRARAKSH